MMRTNEMAKTIVRISAARSLWHRAKALNDRIENCWIGDLLATAGLCILFPFTFILLGVL